MPSHCRGFGAPPLLGYRRQADMLEDTGLVQDKGSDQGQHRGAAIVDVRRGTMYFLVDGQRRREKVPMLIGHPARSPSIC